MTCKITLQIGHMSAAVECSSNEDAAAILKFLAGFDDRKVGHVTDTPWYPDDSGEWVEVPDDLMDQPPGLKAHDLVETLLRDERNRRKHSEGANSVDLWYWDIDPKRNHRIVAYKVVKP